jgi:hypothetical protein
MLDLVPGCCAVQDKHYWTTFERNGTWQELETLFSYLILSYAAENIKLVKPDLSSH